jgi:peptidyl-prolyl cis-trans isomerase C
MEELAKEGLTLDKVRRNIRKNLLVQAVVEQKILPQVKVTDEDIQSLYQANQDKFKHDEMVGARHILIQVPKEASEEQKKAAQEKIASLRKELVEGKDFAEMAKANSNCPSRTKGGDLGYFEKGRMVPEFANVAFSLKEGEISEVVETSFGYHVIQVYGKKPAGTYPLEEVRDQVEKEVQNQKAWEAIMAYIQKLQKSAKIQILDKSLAAK